MTINYYGKIGTTELGAYVEEVNVIGGNANFSSAGHPGTDRYSMRHEGISPRGWGLILSGILDAKETTIDSIIALFKNAVVGDKFYPYRATKFARILKADAWEGKSSHYHQPYWGAEALVYIDPALLFADTAHVWYPDGDEKHAITPAGTVAAPLDELVITGSYASGHVELPTLEIWDAAGTTLEDSVIITDMLLSDEVLTLDYNGKITQVYTDTFTNSTKFMRDATNEGCTIENDGLTIGQSCSATWKLSGPWPLYKNIAITGSIVEGSGNLYLQYSYDNITWRTAISNDDLTGNTTWTVTNTKGHGDVYIRFSSYSGGTDSEERTVDTILAEIIAASRNRDDYYAGVWGRTFNASTYMFLVKLDSTKFAYQIQQAGDPVYTLPWYVGTEYEAATALYDASVVVTVPDRTSSKILADITTPSPAKDREAYYKGVWGRISGSSTYAFLIKLDSGKYAYQIQQAGDPVLTNAWAIGTDAEAAAALYAASVITGDRSEATILNDITSVVHNRDDYYKGVWGRTNLSGYYAYVIKLSVNQDGSQVYAYQIQPGGNPIYTLPWYIGTADQAASALYAVSTHTQDRTTTTMRAEITAEAAARNRNDYYNGVWGRTFGSGYYAYLVRLKSNLYAYQIQPPGDVQPYNNWYVGTRTQAATALYNASSGTRTVANIETDILNTVFGNYSSPSIYWDVYGYNSEADLYCRLIKVSNSPLVIAYEGHMDGVISPTWYIDTQGGSAIVQALVDAAPLATLNRTLATIKADIVNAGWADVSTTMHSVDGPFAGQKPSAVFIRLNNSPQAFAYVVMSTDGVWSNWAIDDQAGAEIVAALMVATPTARTAANIQAEINASGFLEPSTYSYTVYGYVNGARPFATIIQVNDSPQQLVYKISSVAGADTAWLIEANAGVDCRDALIAGFSGVSGGRVVSDIRVDISNHVFPSPTTYDWQTYGLSYGQKPFANIIQVQNSGPRVFAYQIDALVGLGSWTIDNSVGTNIAALLVAGSSVETDSGGSVVLASMTITQERRIPWQDLPVLPLDGLAHCVRLLNGPPSTGQWSPSLLKATAVTRGTTEVFTATAATGSKVYLQASDGKYLTSSWGDEYVSCSTVSPGPGEEFEIISLGTIGSNPLVAIRCFTGKYLSATDAGAGFVLTDSLTVGQAEIFEQITVSAGNYAFKIFSQTSTRTTMHLDEDKLDVAVLDGDCGEDSMYAGRYLTAVPGTFTGTTQVTATYRDRYYI